MVGASEVFGITPGLTAKFDAAVSTAVDKNMDGAVVVARLRIGISDQHAGAIALVARIGRPAHLAVTADHRHTGAGARAQKQKLQGHGAILGDAVW